MDKDLFGFGDEAAPEAPAAQTSQPVAEDLFGFDSAPPPTAEPVQADVPPLGMTPRRGSASVATASNPIDMGPIDTATSLFNTMGRNFVRRFTYESGPAAVRGAARLVDAVVPDFVDGDVLTDEYIDNILLDFQKKGEVMKTDPRWAGSFWAESLPTMGADALAMIMAGLANPALGAAVATSMGAEFMYEDAKRYTDDPTQLWLATLGGGALGMTDILPWSKYGKQAMMSAAMNPSWAGKFGGKAAVEGLDKTTQKVMEKIAANPKLAKLENSKILMEAMQGGSVEGVQEALQTMGENAWAYTIYDENRELFDGVGEAGAGGGIIGTLFGGIRGAALRHAQNTQKDTTGRDINDPSVLTKNRRIEEADTEQRGEERIQRAQGFHARAIRAKLYNESVEAQAEVDRIREGYPEGEEKDKELEKAMFKAGNAEAEYLATFNEELKDTHPLPIALRRAHVSWSNETDTAQVDRILEALENNPVNSKGLRNKQVNDAVERGWQANLDLFNATTGGNVTQESWQGSLRDLAEKAVNSGQEILRGLQRQGLTPTQARTLIRQRTEDLASIGKSTAIFTPALQARTGKDVRALADELYAIMETRGLATGEAEHGPMALYALAQALGRRDIADKIMALNIDQGLVENPESLTVDDFVEAPTPEIEPVNEADLEGAIPEDEIGDAPRDSDVPEEAQETREEAATPETQAELPMDLPEAQPLVEPAPEQAALPIEEPAQQAVEEPVAKVEYTRDPPRKREAKPKVDNDPRWAKVEELREAAEESFEEQGPESQYQDLMFEAQKLENAITIDRITEEGTQAIEDAIQAQEKIANVLAEQIDDVTSDTQAMELMGKIELVEEMKQELQARLRASAAMPEKLQGKPAGTSEVPDAPSPAEVVAEQEAEEAKKKPAPRQTNADRLAAIDREQEVATENDDMLTWNALEQERNKIERAMKEEKRTSATWKLAKKIIKAGKDAVSGTGEFVAGQVSAFNSAEQTKLFKKLSEMGAQERAETLGHIADEAKRKFLAHVNNIRRGRTIPPGGKGQGKTWYIVQSLEGPERNSGVTRVTLDKARAENARGVAKPVKVNADMIVAEDRDNDFWIADSPENTTVKNRMLRKEQDAKQSTAIEERQERAAEQVAESQSTDQAPKNWDWKAPKAESDPQFQADADEGRAEFVRQDQAIRNGELKLFPGATRETGYSKRWYPIDTQVVDGQTRTLYSMNDSHENVLSDQGVRLSPDQIIGEGGNPAFHAHGIASEFWALDADAEFVKSREPMPDADVEADTEATKYPESSVFKSDLSDDGVDPYHQKVRQKFSWNLGQDDSGRGGVFNAILRGTGMEQDYFNTRKFQDAWTNMTKRFKNFDIVRFWTRGQEFGQDKYFNNAKEIFKDGQYTGDAGVGKKSQLANNSAQMLVRMAGIELAQAEFLKAADADGNQVMYVSQAFEPMSRKGWKMKKVTADKEAADFDTGRNTKPRQVNVDQILAVTPDGSYIIHTGDVANRPVELQGANRHRNGKVGGEVVNPELRARWQADLDSHVEAIDAKLAAKEAEAEAEKDRIAQEIAKKAEEQKDLPAPRKSKQTNEEKAALMSGFLEGKTTPTEERSKKKAKLVKQAQAKREGQVLKKHREEAERIVKKKAKILEKIQKLQEKADRYKSGKAKPGKGETLMAILAAANPKGINAKSIQKWYSGAKWENMPPAMRRLASGKESAPSLEQALGDIVSQHYEYGYPKDITESDLAEMLVSFDRTKAILPSAFATSGYGKVMAQIQSLNDEITALEQGLSETTEMTKEEILESEEVMRQEAAKELEAMQEEELKEQEEQGFLTVPEADIPVPEDAADILPTKKNGRLDVKKYLKMRDAVKRNPLEELKQELIEAGRSAARVFQDAGIDVHEAFTATDSMTPAELERQQVGASTLIQRYEKDLVQRMLGPVKDLKNATRIESVPGDTKLQSGLRRFAAKAKKKIADATPDVINTTLRRALRNISYGGLLGPEYARVKSAGENLTIWEGLISDDVQATFDRELAKAEKQGVDPNQIIEALHSDDDALNTLPTQLRRAVQGVRDRIDHLHEQIFRELEKANMSSEDPAVKNYLVNRMQALSNMTGRYVMRAYEADVNQEYRERMWGDDPEMTRKRNAAMDVLVEKLDLPEGADPEASALGYLRSLVYDMTSPTWVESLQEQGPVQRSNLRRRTNLPEEVREFLGEVKNPRLQVAQTLAAQNHALGTLRMMDTLASYRGPNGEVFASRVPDPEAGLTAQLGTGLDYGAMAGMYVDPNMKEAFEDQYRLAQVAQRTAMGKFFSLSQNQGVKAFKMAKTLGSIGTHFRNVFGNATFAEFANVSVFNPANLEYYVQAMSILQQFHGKSSQMALSPELREAIDGGVLGSQFYKDPRIQEGLESLKAEFLTGDPSKRNMGRAVRDTFRNIKDQATHYYLMEDQLFRVASFLKQRNKGKSVEEAARWTNMFFPDYDSNARAVSAGVNAGVLNPFLAFTASLPRIWANAATANPLKFGVAVVASNAALMGASSILGLLTGDDEEREWNQDRQKLQLLMPEWARQSFIYKDPTTGKVKAINLQNVLPWLDQQDMVMTPEGDLRGISGVGKEIVKRTVGGNPLIEGLVQTAGGKTSDSSMGARYATGPLGPMSGLLPFGLTDYEPLGDDPSASDRAQVALTHLTNAVTPGTITQFDRFVAAANQKYDKYGRPRDPYDTGLGFFGVSQSEPAWDVNHYFESREQVRALESTLTIAKSYLDNGRNTPYEKLNEQYAKVKQDLATRTAKLAELDQALALARKHGGTMTLKGELAKKARFLQVSKRNVERDANRVMMRLRQAIEDSR